MKRISKAVLILVALLGLGALTFSIVDTHDDAFSEEGLLTADAAELRRTVVTPVLETPLAGGKNVLWCGSFQLAWNEACTLVGEDLQFVDEHSTVSLLNQKTFTEGDLDAESYVAVADFVRNDVFGQIERQLEDKFVGRATPRLIPSRALTPRPQDIVAYAYLFKHLEFGVPFERIEQPIVFGDRNVACFGIGEEYKHEHDRMRSQLAILDYRDHDDFVIELRTTSDDDRLILAKIQPAAALGATVTAVQQRAAAAQPTSPEFDDVLKAPKFNFDVTRRYRELEGKRLLVNNPQVADDLQILSAVQNVRFQFDEQGVRLRSESHIAIGCAAQPRPPEERRMMVFDKPFLVMLQRRDSDTPYFALWVDNPELLVKVEK